ncbi:hypothetical protein FACS1894216_05230 [Synergistales bacterium]|nr:hypothetical protein FACS1894216_05230 [Synergistales bacterium]
MDFSRFVANVIGQDSRNRFEKYDGNLDIVPYEFKPFYREYNPVDVEVASEIGDVRFCPADDLAELQSEYAYLNAQFVFATTNGDPIFFHEGQIYTCPHGMKEPEWEILDSIDWFFK